MIYESYMVMRRLRLCDLWEGMDQEQYYRLITGNK